jgi:hypothetical protein
MVPHSDSLRRQEENPTQSLWQISATTAHSHHGTFWSRKVNSSRYSFRLQVRVETQTYTLLKSAVHCYVCYCTKQRLNISANTAFSKTRFHDIIYLAFLQCHHITPHKFWKTCPSSGTLNLTKNQTAAYVIIKHIWKIRQKFLKRLVNRIWLNLIKYN